MNFPSMLHLVRPAGGWSAILRISVAASLAIVAASLYTTPAQGESIDYFGTLDNAFAIDFVRIGNTGNAADTTGYGAVPYEYRMGTYEITQDQITKAMANGMQNVSEGPWTAPAVPNGPATNLSWYEAAVFVNWLNTSRGKQAAYNLTSSGSLSMTLWSSADAWQQGGENLYRHKDAVYFLPSENEWYKAAYYDFEISLEIANYFLYPTASDTAPTPVASGTSAGTAVYEQGDPGIGIGLPTGVNVAGGLSPYGTMGQGGNVFEWIESAFDGTNNAASEPRVIRGGAASLVFGDRLLSSTRTELVPDIPPADPNNPDPVDVFDFSIGFRVASVHDPSIIPEPSTYAMALAGIACGGYSMWRRKRA